MILKYLRLRLSDSVVLVQKVFATKSAFSSANPRTPASGRRSPDASLCVAVGLTNAARTAVSLARDIAESCAELASSNDPRRRPRHRRSLLGFVLAIARGAISLDRRDGAAGPQPCHGQERRDVGGVGALEFEVGAERVVGRLRRGQR